MGELSNKSLQMTVGNKETIRVVFKKIVFIKQYETETIELESTIELDKPVTGIERAVIETIVLCNLETAGYANMLCKGIITEDEYKTRIDALGYNLRSIDEKAKILIPDFNIENYIRYQGENPHSGLEDTICSEGIAT